MSRFDPRPASPGQLALIGGALIALAWFGLLGPAGPPVLYLGAALLVVAGASWIFKPSPRTQYWRGREIDMSAAHTWWERLYYRVYRKG